MLDGGGTHQLGHREHVEIFLILILQNITNCWLDVARQG